MDKKQICDWLSPQIKLVRIEYGYTQEEMAHCLGISKKTLVQIEKGRQSASWTQIAALCALFQESAILAQALGGEPLSVIRLIGHHRHETPKFKTMGGRAWWVEIRRSHGFVIQQNIVLPIYRILDDEDRLWEYSFDRDFIEEQFALLVGRKQKKDGED